MRPLGIGIYAPAGLVTDAAALARATARLAAAGHEVVVDPTCASRWQRFSAPDDERLAAVARMAADPRVELAIAARGGYGWSRLLDRIDFPALARAREALARAFGFHRVPARRAGPRRHGDLAGPMAAYDLGAEAPSAFTDEHLWAMLADDRHEVRLPLDGPDLAVEGTLWGGNLALVAHLVGTRHFPRVDGGILFLEDVGEHPYRVERMLHQLHFAGVLATQQAVLLGAFTEYATGPQDDGYDLAAVVDYARERFGVPICTGLPFGHVPDKLTLPVGGHAALSIRDGAATLALSAYAG